MGFLFWKKARPEKPSILARSEPPRDEQRLGPDPAPPPTPHPPRVSVHPFQGALRSSCDVPAGSSAAVLVLTRAALAGEARTLQPGDVLYRVGPASVALTSDSGLLLDLAPTAADDAPAFLGRDELAGRGITGITGLRALRRTGSRVTLRLGPPPGARWVVVGLRALAVFTGKLTLIDAEEPREVRAGELAIVGDPTATLYLQAGNDSALAVGFAGPELVVALG